jgi:hypothetical protein
MPQEYKNQRRSERKKARLMLARARKQRRIRLFELSLISSPEVIPRLTDSYQ